MIVIGYDLVSYLLHYSSARYVTFKELFVCKSNNKTGNFEMNPPDFFYLNTSFFRKNLAFPNPYLFKHPKRKRPMRQKDALKKMSDKREADKIV